MHQVPQVVQLGAALRLVTQPFDDVRDLRYAELSAFYMYVFLYINYMYLVHVFFFCFLFSARRVGKKRKRPSKLNVYSFLYVLHVHILVYM